jgi:hypothetical protein
MAVEVSLEVAGRVGDQQTWLCSLQSKRRFERDCKEADRAQQYFEKMDADINVTKADVEKVRGLGLTSLERASCTAAERPGLGFLFQS